jgi:hypothetical protein
LEKDTTAGDKFPSHAALRMPSYSWRSNLKNAKVAKKQTKKTTKYTIGHAGLSMINYKILTMTDAGTEADFFYSVVRAFL